ncbi:orotidine 5'-phosphate decarboxylase / HUMPS family protein [Paenibacillus hodogayensis]|uniref:Orotidine 5'-phosphate decarboxylase / HUMPS family protein n=1 Tax=Paenibacillus hodogayensis TaxID=279208 RepID=A0ABV5VXE0_9BACL
MKKPWVQIAIDTLNAEKAQQYTGIALKAGADWIEAGTPLLYYEGIGVIEKMVKFSGDVPVVADFKAQDGVYKYFAEAARQGAKVATVLAQMNEGSIKEAVRAGKEHGIQVCADLFSVPPEELAQKAKAMEALGVDYLLKHLGMDETKYYPERKCSDYVKEIVEAVSIPVGVSTFGIEDALESLAAGASFIVQGEPILSSENALEKLTAFIAAVKATAN